ncbi:AMP-binding protein [Streptomyces albireticuli]|uniref:Phenazine antibiotic biosynthesis protein n=1 Tax=Streptomyces albireticuli TaxID=1940 RepID=A0A2A2CYU6_9ACTN|nr:AMP-binding protein [Streptomyces albireticuli]MCD9143645.1 AMP-binding protein [Streptomyces albireticuli]MCD9161924.1 AMP-binding protein [Streptomyces albireticuli]MCD9191762.1 AMP-binding protein [Streptomyces albireticuli]PAU44415.1 phenazine antibiotic biosynthesis protein [Streptomyces albireticuli]
MSHDFEQLRDPDEFVRAAMQWHFGPDTGSPYWLDRARSLEFDPRTDVRTFDDLSLFPNIVNELRDVRVEDLVPRGYDGDARPVGVYESGGTTGAPKKVVLLEDWLTRNLGLWADSLKEHGVVPEGNWLNIMPSGPHLAGPFTTRMAQRSSSVVFTLDMDPRWVKRLIAEGRAEDARAYAEHVIEQAGHILRTQDVRFLMTTPPLLQRLARREELVELVNRKVDTIIWGGASMDADTRYLLRTEVFPGTRLIGNYGSTMALGSANERPGLGDDDPCVFDTLSPFITYTVVDPETGRRVPYGERGRVVMHHVSRSALFPNNLERDEATRTEPRNGSGGDAVADVAPVATFDDTQVIEGVY